jgi:hypothetical protein
LTATGSVEVPGQHFCWSSPKPLQQLQCLRGGLGGCLYHYLLEAPVSATAHIEALQHRGEAVMDKYGLTELAVPVKTTDDTRYHRSTELCDSFIYETRGPEGPGEVTKGPGHRIERVHTMTAPPASVLPDPEVTRLQRALKDVRFCLERGDWQTALAAARAALIRD